MTRFGALKALVRHPDFRAGARDLLVVTPGLAAWGVMTGVAIVKSGMGLVAILVMSICVFAGSSQLAALPLIAAGAPAWVIVATAICVNLRFVVFSLHLRPYVLHQSLSRRLLSGYLLADFGYVLVVRRYPVVPTDPAGIAALEAYWLGVGFVGWTSWAGTTLVGVVLGNAVPVAWGLGFAGILALLAVAASLVTSPLRLAAAAIAAGAAVVAVSLPLKLNIVTAIAAAVAACLAIEAVGRAAPSKDGVA